MRTPSYRTLSTRGLLAALALAGAAVGVQAQNTPTNAPGQGPSAQQRADWQQKRAERQQQRADRHAKHMADLKAALKLSAAQEGAWTQFTQAMQPPAREAAPRLSRDEFAKLTTPQRIDRMQQFANERHQQMTQRGDAVKAFYAQLNAEQQKTFDQQASRFGPGAGHFDHGGPGGPGGPGNKRGMDRGPR